MFDPGDEVAHLRESILQFQPRCIQRCSSIIGQRTANRQTIPTHRFSLGITVLLQGSFQGTHSSDVLLQLCFSLSIGFVERIDGIFEIVKLTEVWLGFVQKSIIVHKYSNIWLMKPFKKCHKSGFIVSFMHFSSELLLLLSQPRLAYEATL